MKIINYALKAAAAAIIFAAVTFAQAPMAQPKQETLLNGLKVLMWPDNTANDVRIRIRIHSGAAFDPAGREGVMKLLADNIFPNEAAREYFRDDLGGGLNVVTNYDYIEINASGRSDSFLQMLETLATAVANPTIDKETTATLRASLLETIKPMQQDVAYVADRAIARRLFGSFPYGRPMYGSMESVQKIQFPDLIDAKQRFLTADNATVAITGNFDRSLGPKAVRRFFGGWLKADKRIPSSFRQPDPPAAGVEMAASPRPVASAIRFAFRGPARKDKDLAASNVFAYVLADRIRARVPGENSKDVFVRSESHTLPGSFVIGADIVRLPDVDMKVHATDLITAALAAPVTDAEFSSARSRFAAEWAQKNTASFWLDADTFGIKSVDADMKAAAAVSLAEVNSYAAKLRASPMAAVLVNTPPATNQ
ncbi:MAG: pitrilysin family protein [Acidobacteriota bacterium]